MLVKPKYVSSMEEIDFWKKEKKEVFSKSKESLVKVKLEPGTLRLPAPSALNIRPKRQEEKLGQLWLSLSKTEKFNFY